MPSPARRFSSSASRASSSRPFSMASLALLSQLAGAGGRVVEAAADLLAGGDGPGAGSLEVDEGVLHLLDHQADEFFGVLGLIEHGVDVGVYDVAETAEDAHECLEWSWVGVDGGCEAVGEQRSSTGRGRRRRIAKREDSARG